MSGGEFSRMNATVSARARRGFSGPILAGLLVICVWLGGCASKQEVSALQRQIWAARRDLDKNKEQLAKLDKTVQEQLAELDDRLEADRQPLRRSQAAVGAQLDQIELDLGRLSGQLEEAAVLSARNGERISEIQSGQMTATLEMQKNVDDLQRRLSLIANYMGLQELADIPKTQGRAEEKTAGGRETAVVAKAAAQQKSPGEAEHYEKAFEMFRAGQFQAARGEFASFLDRNPKSSLADNAQFWLGECYYSEKKYREAIAAYERTIKNYPASNKISSALLKQAMAFLELGDKTAGEILLKKVVKGYPDSSQARIAKSKLAKIK